MACFVKLLGAALFALPALAVADSLPDPTRPPLSIGSGAPLGTGDGGGLRLQSVFLPAKGRAVAVINGQMVGVGDKVGDGRLARLSESEAVIVGSKGVQRLHLTPEVDKVSLIESGASRTSGQKKENP